MAFTTVDKSSSHFRSKLYSGTGSAQSITGVGFQPDWCWIKNASSGSNYSHQLYDATRGVTKYLQSNSSASETTQAEGLTAFGTDGFSVGTNAGANSNGSTLISWNWKAGTTSGITTNGSTVITPSAYSFNQTSGFSVVKYTGNGNTTTKVAHGLGAVPKMLIIKNLGTTDNWRVYHVSVGNDTALKLDSNGLASGGSDQFYDTTPDTVNFTLGNHAAVNASGNNYIAYCFADVKGYQRCGSYQGNAESSNNTFVYTGFAPELTIIKRVTGGNEGWYLNDKLRSLSGGNNVNSYYLLANESNAQGTSTSLSIDLLSNGFKIKNNDTAYGTDQQYIYYAVGQSIVGSNNTPALAR